MATTTFKFDDQTEELIQDLKESFGASSKAEVIRISLGVLDMIDRALEEGLEIAFIERGTQGKGIQRIQLATPAGGRRSRQRRSHVAAEKSDKESK